MPNLRTLKQLLQLSCSLIDGIDSDSKHVSFVLRKNKILSFGTNKSLQTHPLAKRFNCRFGTMHSELSAILKAKKSSDFIGVTLVNIRLSATTLRSGVPILRNSKPCAACMRLILSNPEIQEVIYTTNEGWKNYDK